MAPRFATLGGVVWDLETWWNESPIFQSWKDYSNILVIFTDSINCFQRLLVFSNFRYRIVAV